MTNNPRELVIEQFRDALRNETGRYSPHQMHTILTAHKSYLSSLIEECEGMKDKYNVIQEPQYAKCAKLVNEAHNSAIDTIITKLKGEL